MKDNEDCYNVVTPSVIIDRYYKCLKAIRRFEALKDAVNPNYADDVIICCEVTAGDIRSILECLEGSKDANEHQS